jgi:CheY-like chemotaxis protein
LRILIVDHVWGQRQKLRGWLVQGGYTAGSILEAEDGVAAMDLLKSLDFAVETVICDWDDPRVDGAALVRETRRLAGAPLDFVAVGDFDGARRAKVVASGAADVITRPIRPELLLQKLVALEKHRAATKRSSPSNTSRFRLLQADSPATAAAPLSAELWEGLRRNARHLEVAAGQPLPVAPAGSRLFWVERGSVYVRESRPGGISAAYRVGAEEFLAEFPFGGGSYASFEAVAESECWVASQDADTVRRLVASTAMLFYYLRNISNNRARLYSRSGLAVEKGLSGTLASLKLLDLFQVLSGARRTGVLRIDGPSRTAFLQFVSGQIVHAECRGQIGEAAVRETMRWTEGQFEFYVGPEIPGVRSVTTDMMTFLMEGAASMQENTP